MMTASSALATTCGQIVENWLQLTQLGVPEIVGEYDRVGFVNVFEETRRQVVAPCSRCDVRVL